MNPIETIEYRNHKIKIYPDENYENPYEAWDMISVMICNHRSYRLGTPKYANKFADLQEIMEYFIDCGDLMDWKQEFIDWCWDRYGNSSEYDALEELIDEKYRNRLYGRFIDKVKVIKSVYLYDHSGLTINLGGFSCPWDSGQVGWIFPNPDRCNEWGKYTTSELLKFLEGDAENYDDYLTGNVYGFVVEGDLCDDSCWGYYGDTKYAIDEAKSSIDYAIDRDKNKRWEYFQSVDTTNLELLPTF